MDDEAYEKRQELLAEYIKLKRFPLDSKREAFVIGLMGLVGSGKSTVATAIGARLASIPKKAAG